MRRRRASRLAAGELRGPLVALTLVAACGPGSPPGTADGAALERIALVASGAVAGAADRVLDLDRLGVADARDAGRVDAGGSRARRFLGGDALRLALDGPFDLRAYGRLVVRARAAEAATVGFRLQVFGPSGRLLGDPVDAALGRDPVDVALAIPVVARGAEPVERLRLVVQPGPLEWLDLIEVRFEHAFGAALARAGLANPDGRPGEPALVDLGGDARRVRALGAGATLAAPIDPRGATALELDVALAPPLDPAPAARLVARWDGDVVARAGPGDGEPWTRLRVPLDGRAPGRLAIALEEAPGALALVGEPRLAWPRPDPPTVLLITSDTHRADHLGAAPGSVDVRTPGLDALAERGLLFTNALSSTNVTVPSHVALLSGVHPRDTGVRDNRSALSQDAPTLAEAFRAAGWLTYGVVAVDILSDGHSRLGQGFDRFSAPVGTRSAAEVVRAFSSWLDEAEGLPLFAWLHVYDAHRPYEPPGTFVEAYWDAARDPRDPSLPDPAERGFRIPKVHADVRDPEYLNALYRAEVSSLDDELGRLLDRPRFARAIVGFTADHGECLGEHGTWTHRELGPHTLRVPLVVAWPDGPRGELEERPVDHLDLGRTLLDLAGLRAAPFEGRSLLAGAAPGDGDPPRFALGGDARSAGLTWRGHYLVLHLEDHQFIQGEARFERHAIELYDLANDPDCQRDLQRERPELAREMRTALVTWLTSGRPRGWLAARSDDAELLDQLAQLGYVYGEDGSEEAALFDPDCTCERCREWR